MRKCDSVYNSGKHTEAHQSKVISNSLKALNCSFLSGQTGSHVSKICTMLCSLGVLPSTIFSLRCGHGTRERIQLPRTMASLLCVWVCDSLCLQQLQSNAIPTNKYHGNPVCSRGGGEVGEHQITKWHWLFKCHFIKIELLEKAGPWQPFSSWLWHLCSFACICLHDKQGNSMFSLLALYLPFIPYFQVLSFVSNVSPQITLFICFFRLRDIILYECFILLKNKLCFLHR